MSCCETKRKSTLALTGSRPMVLTFACSTPTPAVSRGVMILQVGWNQLYSYIRAHFLPPSLAFSCEADFLDSLHGMVRPQYEWGRPRSRGLQLRLAVHPSLPAHVLACW